MLFWVHLHIVFMLAILKRVCVLIFCHECLASISVLELCDFVMNFRIRFRVRLIASIISHMKHYVGTYYAGTCLYIELNR